VSIVADAVGSIPLYDALCREQDSQSRCGSENSIAEDPEEATSNDSSSKDHFNSSASFRTTTTRSATHLQAPQHRRLSCSPSSETSGTNHKTSAKPFLDFQVGDVFLLGSPLAMVLAYRRFVFIWLIHDIFKEPHSIPPRILKNPQESLMEIQTVLNETMIDGV